MRFVFLLFIVVPIVEMWLLITVGAQIGAFFTIGLVVLTALIGIQLLREQGFETLWRGHRKLNEGLLPAQEIGEGIILAVSGALLLTPGFVTDTIGFAGLIAPIRRMIVLQLLGKVLVTGLPGNRYRGRSNKDAGENSVIEGEVWDDQTGL